ncbi:alpha-amylase family glycosyl hydrolase [Rhizobium lentis]|uniref:alpha-amylase family glycosyl hydrolase n=1 Tax=Rhizobium lentis TaxID=1138194 RepID=UPI002180A358|nr:hypothetical protein [Rhizobium lentis]
MTNVPFTSISQYRDIETINMHRLHVEAGLSPEEFIRGANENGRDNARTPMQWSAAPYGGFSAGVPWIEVNPNYPKVNAEAAIKDERSIWNHYRKLIALRKTHPVIVYGEYRPWLDQHPDVFVYTRALDRSWIIVVAKFTPRNIALSLPTELAIMGECLICNYEPVHMIGETVELKPYETFAIECK